MYKQIIFLIFGVLLFSNCTKDNLDASYSAINESSEKSKKELETTLEESKEWKMIMKFSEKLLDYNGDEERLKKDFEIFEKKVGPFFDRLEAEYGADAVKDAMINITFKEDKKNKILVQGSGNCCQIAFDRFSLCKKLAYREFAYVASGIIVFGIIGAIVWSYTGGAATPLITSTMRAAGFVGGSELIAAISLGASIENCGYIWAFDKGYCPCQCDGIPPDCR